MCEILNGPFEKYLPITKGTYVALVNFTPKLQKKVHRYIAIYVTL